MTMIIRKGSRAFSKGTAFSAERIPIMPKYIATKDRWILRNKFTVEYNIKGLPLNPFASVDFGVGLSKSTFKQKYTAGLDFNINKQNRLTTWYRFSHEDDDDEPNGHLVGLSYKFEF